MENEEEASQHLREQRRAPRGGAPIGSPSNSRSPQTPQVQASGSHSGSGRKSEAQQKVRRAQGSPRDSPSSPRVERYQGQGVGAARQQQSAHRGATPRAERSAAPSTSASAVKKRVPGVVPAAKTRTSKQAFSL